MQLMFDIYRLSIEKGLSIIDIHLDIRCTALVGNPLRGSRQRTGCPNNCHQQPKYLVTAKIFPMQYHYPFLFTSQAVITRYYFNAFSTFLFSHVWPWPIFGVSDFRCSTRVNVQWTASSLHVCYNFPWDLLMCLGEWVESRDLDSRCLWYGPSSLCHRLNRKQSKSRQQKYNYLQSLQEIYGNAKVYMQQFAGIDARRKDECLLFWVGHLPAVLQWTCADKHMLHMLQ